MFLNYDECSDEYDSNYTSEMSKRENLAVSKVLNRFIYYGYSVIDIGCGTGFVLDICKKIDREKYHGIEISHNMCCVAKEKYPECDIINADIQNISLKENEYSIAVSTFSIPYIGVSSVEKIYNSLRNGGFFIAVYYEKPYFNEDSVYHNRKLKYWITVKPLVKKFIKEAKKKFQRVVVDELLTTDGTYRVTVFKKLE